MTKKMGLADIETTIAAYEKKLIRLEEEHAQIRQQERSKREEIAEIKTILDPLYQAKNIMLGKPAKTDPPPSAPPTVAGVRLRSGSIVSEVVAILSKHGRPLHLKAIQEQLSPRDRLPSLASLENQIGYYARRGKLFAKVSERTYGLLAWQGQTG